MRRPTWVATIALPAIAGLYLPMLAVGAMSFNSSRLGVVWRGFTLDWYHRLLNDEAVLHALRNTLMLALASTVIATVLGTLMAIGMDRFPWPQRLTRLFDNALYLPVVSPDIIFAAAMVVVFRLIRELTGLLEPGLATMTIAHVTFQISFVALVVRARLHTIGPEIEEAARDLYADTFFLFRRVTLPLLLPGIVGGAMLALTLSLDDFVISFFTSGPDSVTLPLYIYASVKRGISPELHALSTVLFLATVLLVLAGQWLARPGGRDAV